MDELEKYLSGGQAVKERSDDELESFLSGKKTSAKPSAKSESKLTPDEQDKIRELLGVANKPSAFSGRNPNLQPDAQPQPQPQPQPQTQPQTQSFELKNLVPSALMKAQELRGQVPGLLASTADVVAGAPSAIAGLVGYGAGRVFGLSDKEAQAASQKVAQPLAQPVGRMTGTAQTQAYQQALPTQIMDYIGSHVQEGAESIAKRFGVSPLDVENAINATLMAGGAALPKVKSAYKSAKQELAPSQLQSQFEAKQGKASSVGAAKTEANPYVGEITGEEAVRGHFPQVKLSKTPQDAPITEQQTRAQIVKEIMGDAGQIRSGVVTGNENTLRNEYTEAKSPNPTQKGLILKEQIANEQNALSNYAKQLVDNTGANPNLVTPYERGQNINSAFASQEGLQGLFKAEKNRLYEDAYSQVGDNPIQTNSVDSLLANKQFRAGLGLKGVENVAKSAEELIKLAKTEGFEDAMGNFHHANTISAWDAVRKALNAEWTPSNASVIRKINQSIDKDIASAGGGDLIKKADRIHEAEKLIYGSKGIKEIFGDIDPNGVETAIAFDKIPSKLNSMPFDQWKHIFNTADMVSKGKLSGPIDKNTGMPKWTMNVPEDIRMAAQSARNEMLGNLAREVYESGAGKAGEWNQNSANKILNARADKINYAFSLEDQKAFHKLNYGGYLMPGVHGYEGAGLQTKRVQGLIESNLGKLGATAGGSVGGFVAGPAGAAGGAYIGGQMGLKGAAKIEERALRKSAEKLQEEMKKNAQLGKKSNLSDIGKQ